MAIDLTGLVQPQIVEMAKREDNPNIAEFRLQPLERGFGHTLGNSLRRLLLSSLPGSAVWAFRLDGVVHEHQTVQGVLEDVHQIVQRLKALTLVLDPTVYETVMRINKAGPGPVYARDIQTGGQGSVVHPEQLLFTVQDDREVNCELYVNKGRGYVESEMHPTDRTYPVDLVRIDAIYNPVRRANFTVTETRVGQRTDYDRLAVSIETNGTISPEDALAYAAELAQEHFRRFAEFGHAPQAPPPPPAPPAPPVEAAAVPSTPLAIKLARSIDDLSLSLRTVNSLKNWNIRTLKDLVQLSMKQLDDAKNVGGKALQEIADLVRNEGLNVEMRFDDLPNGDVRVVNEGVAPVVPLSAMQSEEA